MPLPESFDNFVAKVVRGDVCHSDGCGKRGEYVLRIKLWAKVDRAHAYPPLESIFNIFACEDHRYDVGASEFWTDEGKRRITAGIRAAGRADPDFDSAEFGWIKASTAFGGGLSMN